MSRIGKLAVPIPKGVTVALSEERIDVKGPKGQISTPTHPKVSYEIEEGQISVRRVDESRVAREQHGLRRTLLANCVEGVEKGFSKVLEIIGVGYKVAVAGNVVEMSLGFSHPVKVPMPAGVEAKAEGNKLTLSGVNKELVGEIAAQIRRIRPPEPYKGKGIKYATEVILRKAGKSGSKK
jgi:large subunit ribosomal protein L6